MPSDEAARAGRGDVVLQLSLHGGQPLTGALRASAGGPPVEFCGWLELMAAITAAHQDQEARQTD